MLRADKNRRGSFTLWNKSTINYWIKIVINLIDN